MIITLTQVRELVEKNTVLEQLAASYSEVAGSKLLRIRETIEKNRGYVSELATIFHIVRLAEERAKLQLKASKRGAVNLVLTSNHRFFGGLESRLMQFYLARSTIAYGDLIVVGRSGRGYLAGTPDHPTFRSVVFTEDLPTSAELADLAAQLFSYERIFVYYSKMSSVLVQRPVVVEVGGLVDIPIMSDPRKSYYIFEPEIDKIVDFFDGEITKVLLHQALLESELARTAARLVSMEEAQRNADGAIKKWNRQIDRAMRSINDAKMLEIETVVLGEKKGVIHGF